MVDLSASPASIADALARATMTLTESGSESARLDAEVLLAWVLGVDRSALLAYPEAPLGRGHAERYESALDRRVKGEPVAYIRGMKEFYGAIISVDTRVLIPRPETETLIDLALERIRNDLTTSIRPREEGPYRVWDVGTGSGAISIALALELRRLRYGDAVRIHLSDTSTDALAVALMNAVAHGLADQLEFSEGDLIDVQPPPPLPVDLLLANLPYIPSGSMGGLPAAVTFEPVSALDGGADGLDVIRRLLPQLSTVLRAGGTALLEIGSDQDVLLRSAAAEALPGWQVAIHADLSGEPRVAQLDAPA